MQVAGYEAVIDCVRAVSRNISAACSSQRTGNSVKKPYCVKAVAHRTRSAASRTTHTTSKKTTQLGAAGVCTLIENVYERRGAAVLVRCATAFW